MQGDVTLVESVEHHAEGAADFVIARAAALGPLRFVIEADERFDEIGHPVAQPIVDVDRVAYARIVIAFAEQRRADVARPVDLVELAVPEDRGDRVPALAATDLAVAQLLRPEEQIDKLGSVGREWMGSAPIRLLDADGKEVPDGSVGELYSRTPYTFDGYWNDPKKTLEAFRGNWCSVGDIARRDSEGYIHLVDRKSNMIISGGENVYPSEVEGVLGSHPMVKDVAVIGLPHDKWGEAVQAVVVLHEKSRISEDELLDWCRGRMAGYKRPQAVRFIADSEMPRTATGKILHRALRDRLGVSVAQR